MDIALFSKIVKGLLSDNDRVIISGLGTFVAEDVPASFSDRGFTINPPYRNVSFVSGGTNDDALARFYALSNNLDLAQAEQVVNDFIADLRDELETKKSVTFPEFGRIRLIGQGRMIFVQDENLEIFPHLDYLEPISLKSLGDDGNETETGKKAKVSVALQTKPAVVKTGKEAGKGKEKEAKKGTKGLPIGVTLLIVLLSLAALALVALAVVGRLYPDFVDQFLYSADQLEILHTQI